MPYRFFDYLKIKNRWLALGVGFYHAGSSGLHGANALTTIASGAIHTIIVLALLYVHYLYCKRKRERAEIKTPASPNS